MKCAFLYTFEIKFGSMGCTLQSPVLSIRPVYLTKLHTVDALHGITSISHVMSSLRLPLLQSSSCFIKSLVV